MLAELVAEGYTLLTPNQRLARSVRQVWNRAQRERGLTVWPQLPVQPLQSWLLKRSEAALVTADPPLIAIDDLLAQELWLQAIEEQQASGGYRLLQVAAAAREAHQARENLLRWGIDCDAPGTRQLFELDEDCATFLAWRRRFETRLRSLGAATASECIARLSRQAAPANRPRVALLACDDLPPLFRDCLERHCESIRELPLEGPEAPLSCAGYPDRRSELLAAARWAHHLYRERPAASIAIVLLDMQSSRGPLEYLLRREFGCLGEDYGSLPVNFSTGITLDRAPVVRDALRMLRMALPSVAVTEVAALMRSRFVRWDDAGSESALRLLDDLYQCQRTTLDTADLRRLACRDSACAPGGLALGQMLLALSGMRELRQTAPPSAWVARFCAVLETWGWPGPGPLDSLEYQQVEQWYQALEQFAGFDRVAGRLDFAEALSWLGRVLVNRISQPRSDAGRVQVLGPLEAAGQRFDHLWLCNMQAGLWPAAPRPSPYIPLSLQRHHDMPHASAERERAFALRLLAQFRRGAGEVQASFARQIDGVPELPSALLPADATRQSGDEAGIDRRWLALRAGLALEPMPVRQMPLSPPEGEALRGGAGLLEDQSQCPFRAFARYRLGASSPPGPVAGVSPLQRGTLLHDALFTLFSGLDNSEALRALDQAAERELISAAVEAALSRLPLTGPRAAPAGWRQLERRRLEGLLSQWLAVERQRSEFAVKALEGTLSVTLPPLQIRLRLDRVDRLPDGGELIIDYKSGRCSVNHWLGERPSSPQLPLYAVAAETPPAAVSFAQVRDGDCGFAGLGAIAAAPGVQDDLGKIARYEPDLEHWPELTERWRQRLQGLADEFVQGRAEVDPQRGACTWCDLGPLCRVGLEQALPE